MNFNQEYKIFSMPTADAQKNSLLMHTGIVCFFFFAFQRPLSQSFDPTRRHFLTRFGPARYARWAHQLRPPSNSAQDFKLFKLNKKLTKNRMHFIF
jgi:hypothetical protein